MKILKFGGTSLGSAERIKNVSTLLDENSRLLVVLSAMSGVTNALSSLYTSLLLGKSDKAHQEINFLNNHFSETAYQLFEKHEVLNEVLAYINDCFSIILQNNESIQLNELLSYGERITSYLFSTYLKTQGRENVLLNALDFISINEDGEPSVENIEEKLNLQLSRNPENLIFVTQGFICSDPNGKIANLKRGGSDYTATLIGAALRAEKISIWTDIDGLHNNDPRYVKNTKALNYLNFDEAAELAYFGAKILHPSSIRPARDRNVAVELKNTMNPSAKGTLISENKKIEGIKAIAAKDGIQIIRIQSGRMLMAHGFLKKIFSVFDRFKIPVDVITTSEVSVSITIEKNSLLKPLIIELEKLGQVQLIDDCSIISAVGSDISINPKVLHPLFKCLSMVQPRMISFGGSRNNITVVLDTDKKENALNLLHRSIFNKKEHEELAN